MRMDLSTITPAQTYEFFLALDPPFETEMEEEGPPEQFTHHQVMRIFAEYFAANHRSFSEKQLRALGDWLSDAVAAGGEIENAVSTCLLEHSRQLKVNRVLAPYLSRQAKDSTHV